MSSHKKSFLQVAIGAALLGFAAVFARFADEASPSVVAFYRMTFALPMILLLSKGNCARLWGRHSLWAFVAGAAFAADLIFWHASMHHTSIAVATFLVGLSPLWVILFQVIFQGYRPSGLFWGAFALTLTGAIFLGLGNTLSTGVSLAIGRGEFLGIMGSFGYAVYTLCFSKARTSLNAQQALFFSILGAMTLAGLWGLGKGETFSGFSAKTWWSLLALSAVVQVFAWSLISTGMGKLTASASSIVLLMQQVATLAFGILLFAEFPTTWQSLGSGLMLLGIALSALR